MLCYVLCGHGHGLRNDFIVGVAKGQLLPKIYKYAYTKMDPIEVFEGGQWRWRGAKPPDPPLPRPTAMAND